MGPLSLRVALPLAWVWAAAVLVLVVWPGRAMADEAVMLVVVLTLAAAGAVLLPLLRQLARRANEADTLAARLAEQEARLARAERQRHETLEKLSHDLRTPLASMQGYLELLLLRHGSLDAVEAQNYLQTAVRHGERLSRLVGDLLELARLEGEDATLQREPFPVAELAHDVGQRFAAAAERARVTLDVQARQAPTPLVLADVRLVERVLSNLVENALRHTPCGGRVAIQIEETEPGGARISVSDTGEGIAAADLEGIFDRYETTARVGDGASGSAGLGLAIARRIAALHGSTLELHSEPGQGTTVTFTLPGPARAATTT